MLRNLSIRDVVLIDRLGVSFGQGLGVLTGETGAGKSILLDALGLALGARSEQRLVRAGAERATVIAEFSLSLDHPAQALLRAQDLEGGETLILRRTVAADGRSRAHINDQPVTVALLRQVGDTLVEVHGQFETQGLLDAAIHRTLLDSYGAAGVATQAMAATVAETWQQWRQAVATREAAQQEMAAARREEDFIRHAVTELSELAPQPGEDESLASQRKTMMGGERLLEGLNAANNELTAGSGVEDALRGALRHLDRLSDLSGGAVSPITGALDRALMELTEAQQHLDKLLAETDLDPRQLERIEERLFTLRAAARKHGVAVDDLAALLEQMGGQLNNLEDSEAHLTRLHQSENQARQRFVDAALALGVARREAASRLDQAIAAELPPLRLDRCRFATLIEDLPESDWGPHGCQRVRFQVATNPGAPLGTLDKVASGGELARLMLALKVVLAKADPVPTLVFDEVDAGIGGATAAAVGDRLARLAADVQVLVVTHSPQVAAKGNHHLRVSKTTTDDQATTRIEFLDHHQRQEEIARMLAGERITDEARAAAAQLMQGVA